MYASVVVVEVVGAVALEAGASTTDSLLTVPPLLPLPNPPTTN